MPEARGASAVALLVFMAGLYCNTGTLTPYANTHFPQVDPNTGFLYNMDHPHYRVLFDFVNGAPREVWDHALLIRRILFTVLAWPFMQVAGFEIGGTIASLGLNAFAFIAVGRLIGRRFGQRAALFGAWLLALYPGAAYWAGLPYSYTLIFPGSLLLTFGIMELQEAPLKKICWLSMAMGVAYLGYDLHPIYIPATFLVLAWHRRFGAAALSCLLQLLPFVVWLAIVRYGLKQPLENSNSGVYSTILQSFLGLRHPAVWWASVGNFDDSGVDVFFGSNFIFLPALFLALLAINSFTSRIRFQPVEIALLATTAALFLFNNLAPTYSGGWNLRGTWMARMYQPAFPALILFAVRWWEHLPPLNRFRQTCIGAVCSAALLGNALIVFGPILDNPLHVSEFAFYRFYNHTDLHWIYQNNLHEFGRRPLGFARPLR